MIFFRPQMRDKCRLRIAPAIDRNTGLFANKRRGAVCAYQQVCIDLTAIGQRNGEAARYSIYRANCRREFNCLLRGPERAEQGMLDELILSDESQLRNGEVAGREAQCLRTLNRSSSVPHSHV